MSSQDPDPQPPTRQLDDRQQWGDTRINDGQQRRQCRSCGNWFNVGWLADHCCPVHPQLRLFDPPK